MGRFAPKLNKLGIIYVSGDYLLNLIIKYKFHTALGQL